MTTASWTRRSALKTAAGFVGASVAGVASQALAEVPQTDGYAAVPGGRIYWRKFGSGGKTPLLTLHGGPGSSHNYLLSAAGAGRRTSGDLL
jgi:proline iminopeptidase